MTVLLLADDELREELLACPVNDAIELKWIKEPVSNIHTQTFDACIDLLFENTKERIKWLNQLTTSLIVINSVIVPLHDIQQKFVRINGWNTFLKRTIAEASADLTLQKKATDLFSLLGRRAEWVPDIEGFITARVVVSIINEAFFALEEKVSTEEEIDIAMKLGTNYPFGPFEWGKKIGLQKVFSLLNALSNRQSRYRPCPLLTKTALA
jgi:3-hydroxybutyryl-CoA dehydrogenase